MAHLDELQVSPIQLCIFYVCVDLNIHMIMYIRFECHNRLIIFLTFDK